MKYWQMSFLLVIYCFSYMWYLTIDYTENGIIDMPTNWALIVLIVMMSFGTMWYTMARKPHLYTR